MIPELKGGSSGTDPVPAHNPLESRRLGGRIEVPDSFEQRLPRQQQLSREGPGTSSRPRPREGGRGSSERIFTIGIHEQVAQGAGRLESSAPRRLGARRPVDNDGRAESLSGADQHPLLEAFRAGIDHFRSEFLELLFYVVERDSIQTEMIPNRAGSLLP